MTGAIAAPIDATRLTARIRPELLRLLDVLPLAKQAQILDFARFLHQQGACRRGPNDNASYVSRVAGSVSRHISGSDGVGRSGWGRYCRYRISLRHGC